MYALQYVQVASMYMWVLKGVRKGHQSPGAETIGNCFTLSRILLRYQRTVRSMLSDKGAGTQSQVLCHDQAMLCLLGHLFSSREVLTAQSLPPASNLHYM